MPDWLNLTLGIRDQVLGPGYVEGLISGTPELERGIEL